MALVYAVVRLLFSHLIVLLLLVLTRKGNGHSDNCPDSFDCGNLGLIKYPFTTVEFPNCGALAIQDCDDIKKTAMKHVQLTEGGKLFQVTNIDNRRISIIDPNITKFMRDNITAFKCNRTRKLVIHPPSNFFRNSSCPDYDFYFGDSISDDESNHSFVSCSMFHLPVNELGFALSSNPFPFLADETTFQYQPSDFCHQCHHRDKNINCRVDRNGQIYCPAR